MRKITTFLFAAVASVVLSAGANASIIVSATSQPAVNLAGFSTWTVRATSDVGKVNGIDITFSGAMNQVNPAGQPTVFQDNNAFFAFVPGADVSQDSQFLFNSTQILSLDTAEGPSLLTGALTNLADFNGTCALCGANELDFAQIVIPDGQTVSFMAEFDDGQGVAVPVEGMIGGGGTGGGPDLGPGGSLDFTFSGEMQTLTLTNSGDATATLAGFDISGDNADLFSLVAPDLSDIAAGASREFKVMLQSGLPNVRATYTAQLTFDSNAEIDPVFALTANVPEPSTVALAGLALVGLVGFTRRK